MTRFHMRLERQRRNITSGLTVQTVCARYAPLDHVTSNWSKVNCKQCKEATK